MIIKTLKITINLIFYSKKEFKFPKKNKIIFLDEVGSKKIKENLLDQIDFTVLHLRYEKVNIPILFLSIFNIFKYGKNFYKITFIKFVNASYAFSFIDTSLHYCDLIKEIPECKFILIQNGRRQGNELEPFLKRLNKSKFKCDYYFVFNKEYANFMKKYIDTHFVVGGSVLNNSHPKAKFIKKIDRIQYISEFHTLESMPTVDYRKWELLPTEFSLKVINNFCNRKNLKLEIIGRTYEHNREIKFYEQFKIPFTYLKKTKENYSHLSDNAIIAGMSSTLLGESFSRSFRVAFFDIRNEFFLYNKYKPGFAFPKKTPEFGEFWSSKPDEIKMTKNLEYLYSVNEVQWNELVKKWSENIVLYDYKNNKYREILKRENLL